MADRVPDYAGTCTDMSALTLDFGPTTIKFDVTCTDIDTSVTGTLPDVAPFSCGFPAARGLTNFTAETPRVGTETGYIDDLGYRINCEIPCQAKKDCSAVCTCNDGDGCLATQARAHS
jgi:hypothetical protein